MKYDLVRYGISRNRLSELRAFCRQYEEFKRRGEVAAMGVIERAAKDADAELAEYILLNVCKGYSYNWLRTSRRMPSGPKRFYFSRRLFYIRLHHLKRHNNI